MTSIKNSFSFVSVKSRLNYKRAIFNTDELIKQLIVRARITAISMYLANRMQQLDFTEAPGVGRG
jgi:hypothetical protein